MAGMTDKSGIAFHLKSYSVFNEFMDTAKYGTMMLVLREKNIAVASARIKAGMDIVDIISAGTDPESQQTLHLHSLRQGDHTVELTHTYQYWAQPATLREFVEEHYHLVIPGLNRPKKENGLLTCLLLDGNHVCYLSDRYIIRTFKLMGRDYHRCREETAASLSAGFVCTQELKKDTACAYCLAEKLNINL